MVVTLALTCAAYGAACSDTGTTTAATTTTEATTTGDPSLPTLPTASTTGDTPTTSDSATFGDSDDATTGEPPSFCEQLDISLVANPGLKIYSPAHRAAFAEFFADMVETTGARVRLLANAGTEFTLKTKCLLPLGNASGLPTSL